jgi:hypothetical protein
MTILEVLLIITQTSDYMTNKIALLSGMCVLAMFLNTACSSTKSSAMNTQTSSTDAKVVKADQTLPAVAEPPKPRPWGSNISPYFN